MSLKGARFLTQNEPEGGGSACWGLIISMEEAETLSLEQIRAFLEVSEEVRFQGKRRREVYDWMRRLLRQQSYRKQGKVARGLLRRYVAKMTGRSRAQVTRLVGQYLKHSEVKEAVCRRHRFKNRYTQADIELLARVDEAHETLSGPATKKILEREREIYQHAEYARLATISAAHIYNLRQRRRYHECRMNYTTTRAVQVAIGERRKPQPGGQPGYLRVDTVHQGDLEGVKGVYHINAVDEVTQWQVVGSVAAITQTYLEPVLRAILSQFPFPIRGFHSDNGSEFINDTVSGLLKDLLIEQTKSRSRKSNDNGLVESKNGAVIRKHMGYGYIAAAHAAEIDRFYQRNFNPYLNFHRPCGQPERITDSRGKEKFVYRRYATPWEVLRELSCALPQTKTYLKPGLSIQGLDRFASAFSDTESARHMQAAKRKLFLAFRQERKSA
jgi:transposase InsO family protein